MTRWSNRDRFDRPRAPKPAGRHLRRVSRHIADASIHAWTLARTFKWITSIFAAAVIVVGGLLYANFSDAAVAHRWKKTTGVITSSRVSSVVTRGRRNNHETTTYYATVEYDYKLGDETLKGSHVTRNDSGFSDSGDAAAAIRGLTPGTPVDVYYDPAWPREPVLRPGDMRGILNTIFAFVFIISALVVRGVLAYAAPKRSASSVPVRGGKFSRYYRVD